MENVGTNLLGCPTVRYNVLLEAVRRTEDLIQANTRIRDVPIRAARRVLVSNKLVVNSVDYVVAAG